MNQLKNQSHSMAVASSEIDLKELAQVLIVHKFILLAFLVAGLFLSLGFAILKPTLYQSSALLQVSPNLCSSSTCAAAELALAFSPSSPLNAPAQAQMSLIQSDAILQAVIDNLKLNIKVTPKYFPIIGQRIALQYVENGVSPARFGLTSYAWGGESLWVSTFDVPLQNFQEKFIVKISDATHYTLYEGSHFILEGIVNKLAVSNDGKISIAINRINARPNTEFYVQRYSDADILANLHKTFTINQLSSQPSNSPTGVLRLSLTTTPPINATQILSTIVDLSIKQSPIAKSSITLLSAATPVNQLPSHLLLTVLAGTFAGFLFGILFIFIGHTLKMGINDPYLLEREFGLRHFYITPYSTMQAKNKKLFDQKKIKFLPILTTIGDRDPMIESLRNLGASLSLMLAKQQGKAITISSITPETGASFIALNLAATLADSGKRVLLIDADMRKGGLHQYFKKPITPGFSDLLSGIAALDQVLHPTEFKNLDFISCGLYANSNLLLRDSLPQLLREIETHYDFIIIDTPPMLAIADAPLIAKYCALNVIVVAAGKTQEHQIQMVMTQFDNHGTQLNGAIFNFNCKDIQATSQYSHQKYYARYHRKDT